MGEFNVAVANDTPILIEKPFPFTPAQNPVIAVATPRTGPVIYDVNIASLTDDTFRLIIVPADRILYATDLPIAIAPGKSVEINDQYTYITPVPWKLSICDTQKRIKFTSFVYEELRAIKKQ